MLRRFEIFEKKFCDEGGFSKKLFEAYRELDAFGLAGNMDQRMDTFSKGMKPTKHTLNAVRFVNTDIGFVAGENGTILRTKDGGASWVDFPDTYANNGDWYDPDDEQDVNDESWSDTNRYSKMTSNLNFEKLKLLELIEYQDIVTKSVEYFEKQIAAGSYGKTIIPPLDTIMDYIISIIGNDYKDYISEEKLDQLTRFIYQEIDNYIFD